MDSDYNFLLQFPLMTRRISLVISPKYEYFRNLKFIVMLIKIKRSHGQCTLVYYVFITYFLILF
jgi:hypothetical protein